MLVADKLNVESSLRVRMLQIREREFDLFLDRIRTIGTLATVLAGLGHAGLLYTKYIDHNLCGTHEGFCAELTYPFFTCIALGASIITMWGCVLLVTQVEREFEVVVSLGAVSVTSFVVCAILFFWAKFGQSVKHFDPNFASRPPLHLSSGLGGYQHHWASSFEHGNKINAVRDMPTAIFLTLMMLTFLYAMYLVKQYLNRRVFYVPRRKIVRGTWSGIEREAPDGRRPVDAPGRLAVGEGRARRDRSEARPAGAADGRGDGVDPRRWARRGVGFRRLVEEG